MREYKLDVIDLLKGDHRDIERLFKKFDSIRDSAGKEEKREIARKVCAALLIHMKVEEAIFYPAIRKVIHDEQLIDQAYVEHQRIKDLIRRIGETSPDSSLFDARIAVLRVHTQRHINEKENEIFPLLRTSHLDLHALGLRFQNEKSQLERAHNIASP